ncbi:hypothetical protein LTR53_014784 [Teratosphaeriaceae sp. CCFEE 6253]|nr:hypothetical protein LTR53_014784 [Teratosphaeriaceae sp. CCFEE 6253]
MARSPHLEALLEAGSITQLDFDAISAELHASKHTSVTLAGHIAIGYAAPSRATLEAVHAVFNTAELLEQILRHLPPSFLLATAPRVCQGWQAAIAGSTAIGRAVFQSPDRRTRRPPRVFYHGPSSSSSRRSGACTIPGLVLTNIVRASSSAAEASAAAYELRMTLAPNRLLIDATKASPSLRNTLLTQPPVRAVSVTMSCGGWGGGCGQATEAWESAGGCTWGQAAEAMERLIDGAGGVSGLLFTVHGSFDGVIDTV